MEDLNLITDEGDTYYTSLETITGLNRTELNTDVAYGRNNFDAWAIPSGEAMLTSFGLGEFTKTYTDTLRLNHEFT